jgi:hypothetical protein
MDGLVKREKDFFGGYVVVANISGINKPILRVGGSASGDEVELELSEPRTFIADGTCLDLEYIEDTSLIRLKN